MDFESRSAQNKIPARCKIESLKIESRSAQNKIPARCKSKLKVEVLQTNDATWLTCLSPIELMMPTLQMPTCVQTVSRLETRSWTQLCHGDCWQHPKAKHSCGHQQKQNIHVDRREKERVIHLNTRKEEKKRETHEQEKRRSGTWQQKKRKRESHMTWARRAYMLPNTTRGVILDNTREKRESHATWRTKIKSEWLELEEQRTWRHANLFRERHMNTKERHMNKKREGLGLDNKKQKKRLCKHQER